VRDYRKVTEGQAKAMLSARLLQEDNMRRLGTVCVLISITLMGFAQATTTINFESDPTGPKPNGWSSVDSPLLSFTDSIGANLDVYDYGHQSHGKALACNPDGDNSYLIMDFAPLANSVQLDFGNDDPGWSNPGDLAVLTAYLGGVQVAQNSVVMNRDDIMNQSISISGVIFDRATFEYQVTAWSPGLIEVVDDIQVNIIPAPGAILLGSIGVGLVGWLRRRRSL
jgi:hypothetical protein